jgi:glycosyltransferase involved in cell wall biosynthesis
LKKQQTIAIYSGQIPSTTFIERLVTGLSAKGQRVLLFGVKKQAMLYPQRVSVIGYKNNQFNKAFHLLKYSLLLLLFNYKEKRALDSLLQSQNRNTLNDKLKSYPVLYHKPDIFHIQWAKSIKDWIWVQDFGMKLVLSLRGTHITISPKTNRYWEDTYLKLFKKVDGFHSVSVVLANEVLRYGVNSKAVSVIKSGVNIGLLKYIEKPAVSKPLQIVSVGRCHFAKGYTYALDAMYALKQMGVHFQYTIIGMSHNEAMIFQRAQLGLEKEVRFIDTLPFKDVKEAIYRSDVLLLPSVEEGVANVVLEAMALGTLVVSSDCGGMAEVVVPNQTGFLVSNRNVQDIAKTLNEVSLLSLAHYQNLTQQARAFVEKHHNEDNMIVEMQSLYQNLIPQKL